MENSFLYSLVKDASLFSNETLPELKKIVDQYPCFSIAKILYLKNLILLDDSHFLDELKRLSVGIPDRRKLFLLIEDKLDHQSSFTMVKEKERENAFDLIDSFLSRYEQKEQSKGLDEILLSSSISSDYIFWSMSKEEEQKKEDKGNQLECHQLIDSFIEKDKERSGRYLIPDKTTDESIEKEEETVLTDFMQTQDESFFTETLAQIYIKQKRYERALQIIGKLSLKYPEKNVYFADQIRFLEKLIINNKNIK